MPETPRTWTLVEDRQGVPFVLLSASPDAPIGERIKVIEAEPVADLLERLTRLIGPRGDKYGRPVIVEAEALLRVLRPEGQAG
jgi:hypothetical protein